LLAHDLFGKPLHTFPDRIEPAACSEAPQNPRLPEGRKQPVESRFLQRPESAFSSLENEPKIPISSKSCRRRLCARRNPPFMAQIASISAFLRR
jgi:hypothetical protein